MTTISIIYAGSGLNEILRSYVVDGRNDKFLVIDQARDAAARNLSIRTLRDIRRTIRREVIYVSAREVATYLSLASRYSWADVESLRYAIDGDHGAACNISMLASAPDSLLIAGGSSTFDVIGTPGGAMKGVDTPMLTGRFNPFRRDLELRFSWPSDERANTLRMLQADAFSIIDTVTHAAFMGTWSGTGARAAATRVRGGLNFRATAFVLGASARGTPFCPGESVSGGVAGQSLWGALSERKFEALPLAVRVPAMVTLADGQVTVSDLIEQSICGMSLPDAAASLQGFTIDDLRSSMAAVGDYMRGHADAAKPEMDYKLSLSDEDAVGQVRGMGRLINAWPGLLAAARDLAKNGVQLGVSV